MISIDPEYIDREIERARARDNTVSQKLLGECARMVAVDQHQNHQRNFSLDYIAAMLKPARYQESGRFQPNDPPFPMPDNGSYAMQLYSAIMFAIDARAELKLLELIASPHFFSAISRSAAAMPDDG